MRVVVPSADLNLPTSQLSLLPANRASGGTQTLHVTALFWLRRLWKAPDECSEMSQGTALTGRCCSMDIYDQLCNRPHFWQDPENQAIREAATLEQWPDGPVVV